MKTAAELEDLLKAVLKDNKDLTEENAALRDEVERCRHQAPAPPGAGGIDDNPLCKGCYAWRLTFAVVFGLALGTGVWLLLEANKPFLQGIAQSLSGSKDDADALQLIAAISIVIGPVLATVAEWKWFLYKRGYPGMFRGIAECYRAFKEGRGLK
jgi:hypothetical protein